MDTTARKFTPSELQSTATDTGLLWASTYIGVPVWQAEVQKAFNAAMATVNGAMADDTRTTTWRQDQVTQARQAYRDAVRTWNGDFDRRVDLFEQAAKQQAAAPKLPESAQTVLELAKANTLARLQLAGDGTSAAELEALFAGAIAAAKSDPANMALRGPVEAMAEVLPAMLKSKSRSAQEMLSSRILVLVQEAGALFVTQWQQKSRDNLQYVAEIRRAVRALRAHGWPEVGHQVPGELNVPMGIATNKRAA